MLLTPYFWVALSARSETKRYSVFSRHGLDLEAGGLDRLRGSRRAASRRRCRRPRATASQVTPSGSWLGADDVGEREPAAGPQRARGGCEHGGLVGREVDHAVGDHAVDASRRRRAGLDVALAELDVREAVLGRRARVALASCCVGHVDRRSRGRPARPCGRRGSCPCPSRCRGRAPSRRAGSRRGRGSSRRRRRSRSPRPGSRSRSAAG